MKYFYDAQGAGSGKLFIDLTILSMRQIDIFRFRLLLKPIVSHLMKEIAMLSPEAKQTVAVELKKFATDLQLSDAQKDKLHTALEGAREKLDEIRKAHPDLTKADVIEKLHSVRATAREHLVKFFTPEQLKKWDAEVTKAKSFLGIG
jgi:periplasmic protein CpxP/Spy